MLPNKLQYVYVDINLITGWLALFLGNYHTDLLPLYKTLQSIF